MKFGKHLKREGKREWEAFYVNYKSLKKSLSGAVEPFRQAAVATTAAFSSRAADQLIHQLFMTQLQAELMKVNQFYYAIEGECTKQYNVLVAQILPCHAPPSEDVLASLTQFVDTLDHLRKYAVLNYIALVKIIKKRNKQIQECDILHPANVLLNQPFYSSRELYRLIREAEQLINQLLIQTNQGSLLDPPSGCPLCGESHQNPIILSCGHPFCWECLCKSSPECQTCPTCRRDQILNPDAFKIDRLLGPVVRMSFPISDQLSLPPELLTHNAVVSSLLDVSSPMFQPFLTQGPDFESTNQPYLSSSFSLKKEDSENQSHGGDPTFGTALFYQPEQYSDTLFYDPFSPPAGLLSEAPPPAQIPMYSNTDSLHRVGVSPADIHRTSPVFQHSPHAPLNSVVFGTSQGLPSSAPFKRSPQVSSPLLMDPNIGTINPHALNYFHTTTPPSHTHSPKTSPHSAEARTPTPTAQSTSAMLPPPSFEIHVSTQPPTEVRTRTPREIRNFGFVVTVTCRSGEFDYRLFSARAELYYAPGPLTGPEPYPFEGSDRIFGGPKHVKLDKNGTIPFNALTISEASTRHQEREFTVQVRLIGDAYDGRVLATCYTSPIYAYSHKKVLVRRKDRAIMVSKSLGIPDNIDNPSQSAQFDKIQGYMSSALPSTTSIAHYHSELYPSDTISGSIKSILPEHPWLHPQQTTPPQPPTPPPHYIGPSDFFKQATHQSTQPPNTLPVDAGECDSSNT